MGSGLTFDIIHPLFRLFHCPTNGGVTHAKIYTDLGKFIVSTPIHYGFHVKFKAVTPFVAENGK